MMAIHDFPRCASYLKAMRFKLDDPSMTEYGWAVALSENWTDEFLVEDGKVNFDTMDGPSILGEFERLLHAGQSTSSRQILLPHADMESLKAFIGSRGVKVAALKSDDDYWTVAAILWPHTISEGQRGPLKKLLSLIKGMTKAQRRTASVNLKAVPAKWLPSRGGRAA